MAITLSSTKLTNLFTVQQDEACCSLAVQNESGKSLVFLLMNFCVPQLEFFHLSVLVHKNKFIKFANLSLQRKVKPPMEKVTTTRRDSKRQ